MTAINDNGTHYFRLGGICGATMIRKIRRGGSLSDSTLILTFYGGRCGAKIWYSHNMEAMRCKVPCGT